MITKIIIGVALLAIGFRYSPWFWRVAYARFNKRFGKRLFEPAYGKDAAERYGYERVTRSGLSQMRDVSPNEVKLFSWVWWIKPKKL